MSWGNQHLDPCLSAEMNLPHNAATPNLEHYRVLNELLIMVYRSCTILHGRQDRSCRCPLDQQGKLAADPLHRRLGTADVSLTCPAICRPRKRRCGISGVSQQMGGTGQMLLRFLVLDCNLDVLLRCCSVQPAWTGQTRTMTLWAAKVIHFGTPSAWLCWVFTAALQSPRPMYPGAGERFDLRADDARPSAGPRRDHVQMVLMQRLLPAALGELLTIEVGNLPKAGWKAADPRPQGRPESRCRPAATPPWMQSSAAPVATSVQR